MELDKCVYGDTVLISVSIIIYAIAITMKTARVVSTVKVKNANIVKSVTVIILAQTAWFAKKVAALMVVARSWFVPEMKTVNQKHKYARITNVF